MATLYESDLQKSVNQAAESILGGGGGGGLEPTSSPTPTSGPPSEYDVLFGGAIPTGPQEPRGSVVTRAFGKIKDALTPSGLGGNGGKPYDPYGMTAQAPPTLGGLPPAAQAPEETLSRRWGEQLVNPWPAGDPRATAPAGTIPGALPEAAPGAAPGAAPRSDKQSALDILNEMLAPQTILQAVDESFANPGAPVGLPRGGSVTFGGGGGGQPAQGLPKDLQGSHDALNRAWDFAVERGLAEPGTNYTREQRHEILRGAKTLRKKELDAFSVRHEQTKKNIGLRVELIEELRNGVLDASRGSRQAGVKAQGRLNTIRRNLAPAIRQYGEDAATAIRNPEALPEGRRKEVLGALGLGSEANKAASTATMDGMLTSMSSIADLGRPENGTASEISAYENHTGVARFLRQAIAADIDMSGYKPMQQLVEAVNTGATPKRLAELKGDVLREYEARFNSNVTLKTRERAELTMEKEKLDANVLLRKVNYYSAKSTSAGISPAKAYDKVLDFMENNPGKLKALTDTLNGQGDWDALSAEDQIMVRSLQVVLQGLSLNSAVKK